MIFSRQFELRPTTSVLDALSDLGPHLVQVLAEEEFGNILDKMLSQVPDVDASIWEDESVAAQDVPFFQQYENSDPPELPPPDHSAGDPWSQAFNGEKQRNKLGHKLRTRKKTFCTL